MALSVVSGQARVRVGTIEPKAGMLTNRGRIFRVTKSGAVYVAVAREGGKWGRRYNKPDKFLTVRHTEARKFGYPHAIGSSRDVTTYIRRGDSLIAA